MIEAHNFEPREAGFGWIINHLPTIVWQRRYYTLSIFLAFLIVSVAVAFALPTLYRSSASLLIESQQLPTEVVESPGTGVIEQRISRIRERVLSRGDLIALIEQYDLYQSERRSQAAIHSHRQDAQGYHRRGGAGDIGPNNSGQSNLIALNMSFDYPDPVKAQEVLQSFVQSFLRMDSDVVEGQATMTVRFLSDQAQRLQGQISQLETRDYGLKARNGSALAGSACPP